MMKIIGSNPSIKHFCLYNFTFVSLGMNIAGLGPLIPYLAPRFHRHETQFSVVFFWRMVGYLLGSIFIKFLIQYTTYHYVISILSLVSAISAIFFIFATSIAQCSAWMILICLCGSAIDITIQLSIISTHRNNNQEKWLQIAYGSIGVGALVIPLLIKYFEEKGFLAYSIILLTTLPFYLRLKTPQEISYVQGVEKSPNSIKRGQIFKEMEFTDSINLGLVLFFHFGQEIGFAGWLSSYTVLFQVQDQQEASYLNTIFWFILTCCRFIFPIIMKGSPKEKFFLLTKLQGITLLISILLENLGLIEISAYFAAIMLGVSFSGMLPLILTVSLYYQKQFSSQVSSTVYFFGILGQGTITMFVGGIIRLFGPFIFYISILLVMLVRIAVFMRLIGKWSHEKQSQSDKTIQLVTFREKELGKC